MNYALNKPYQRLCMSRDLNGQRTLESAHFYQANVGLHSYYQDDQLKQRVSLPKDNYSM